jgi:hypothetical protein
MQCFANRCKVLNRIRPRSSIREAGMEHFGTQWSLSGTPYGVPGTCYRFPFQSAMPASFLTQSANRPLYRYHRRYSVLIYNCRLAAFFPPPASELLRRHVPPYWPALTFRERVRRPRRTVDPPWLPNVSILLEPSALHAGLSIACAVGNHFQFLSRPGQLWA